jgi:hypothetical protein
MFKQGGAIDSAVREDGQTIRLVIADKPGGEDLAMVELTTEQLDIMLHQLGKNRATMVPAHPRKLEPNPVFRDVSRDTVFHIDREHVVGKEFFIAVLHPAYGWLAFPMGVESGNALAALIKRQVDAMTPKIIMP